MADWIRALAKRSEPSPVVLDDERSAFEVWASQKGWPITGGAVCYTNPTTEKMWEAWQARATSSQPVAQMDAVGWFVQRTEFGPWVEIEEQEPGAVQLYRAAQADDALFREMAAWLHAAYDRPPQSPEARKMLGRVDAALAAAQPTTGADQ